MAKTKLIRFGHVERKGDVAILHMEDKQLLAQQLLEVFGHSARVKLTFELIDVNADRSDHVHYRVNVLPALHRAMIEQGNNWTEERTNDELKKNYLRLKRGEPIPSLSGFGRLELKKYILWCEEFALDWFGIVIPRYSDRFIPQ